MADGVREGYISILNGSGFYGFISVALHIQRWSVETTAFNLAVFAIASLRPYHLGSGISSLMCQIL